MRRFKTSKENRTEYIYHFAKGPAVHVTPEEVGTTWVAKLHGEDDAICNNDRKESRYIAVHYGAYIGSDSEDFNGDKLAFMADPNSDPLERIIESFEEQEKRGVMLKLKAAIQKLQPQQIDLIYQSFYARRSNVDIAEELGVTEAAIRNRLKKIYARLGKLMADPTI